MTEETMNLEYSNGWVKVKLTMNAFAEVFVTTYRYSMTLGKYVNDRATLVHEDADARGEFQRAVDRVQKREAV